MRASTSLATLAILATLGTTGIASAEPVTVFESKQYSEVTEGETVLEIDADTAYATLSDFGKWTTVFPDIKQVIMTKRSSPTEALVGLQYADHRNNLHFKNDPSHRRIWFENTNSVADMWADLQFIPGPRPGTTIVHGRVYADVTGASGVFVSESRLRNERTTRVRGDLTKLRAYFATPRMVSSN